jgi:ribose transport system permease protein
MSGGKGSIIGALIGSLLMGMISNGLIIGGFSVSQQMIIRGAIIVLAVVLGSLGNKRKMDKA